MKHDAHLGNMPRGETVDRQATVALWCARRIGDAALEVPRTLEIEARAGEGVCAYFAINLN